MQVENIKDLDDCFDGTFIKEILLDGPITEKLIYYLGIDAQLQYFPEFARPFYRIDKEGFYIIKGIEGNYHFRIILSRKNLDNALAYLIENIKTFE